MADYRSFIFFWRALSGQAFGFIFFVTLSTIEVPIPQKRIPPQSFTQTLLQYNQNCSIQLPKKTLRTLQLKT